MKISKFSWNLFKSIETFPRCKIIALLICTSIEWLKFICIQVTELRQQGGRNIEEAVSRMLKRLLTVQLQRMFNRTGANGKLSFSSVLETLVKGRYNLLTSVRQSIQKIAYYKSIVLLECNNLIALAIDLKSVNWIFSRFKMPWNCEKSLHLF